MKISPRPRILLGLAAVAAVGLVWWLLARGGQGAAPVATAPKEGVEHRTEVAPAPAEPEPVAAATSVPVAPAQIVVPPALAMVPVAATSASSLQPSALSAVVLAPPTAPAAPPDEVAATERMYLAHASLRDPEVANPDSESNRRILQTMVTKALSAPEAIATTSTPAASTAH